MTFPITRMRRLRQTTGFRRMFQENRLSVDDLILPLFVQHGVGERTEIASMPGVYRFTIDWLIKEAREAFQLGIPAIILFGIPKTKDEEGSEAFDPKGIVQEAVRAVKDQVPELMVITDICIDEYSSHGHCGVIRDGQVDNDLTLEVLARVAISHAQAGADMLAPSDMMDGRVGAIRLALDKEGFSNLPIMAYSAKYASCFYGPFREAADSSPKFGDRLSYQMDPPNVREALREVALDIEEGADVIMVKPALPYLDVIWRVKERFQFPVAAYQVSGEYSMIQGAHRLGWVDGPKAIQESLLSIKRAGADLILTYFAKEAARMLGR